MTRRIRAATFTLVSDENGVATFHYSDSTPISATSSSPYPWGPSAAYVPNSAGGLYMADKLLFNLGNIKINLENSRATRALSAFTIQVNSYFGDVNADGQINGTDTTDANYVATSAATGFHYFQQLDPVIVGDAADDLSVDAGDVTVIDAFVAMTRIRSRFLCWPA